MQNVVNCRCSKCLKDNNKYFVFRLPFQMNIFLFKDINWKKNLKENDDGYSSIDDTSTPANARKSIAVNQKSSSENSLSVAKSSPRVKQKHTTLKLHQGNRDQIFEMQNIGFRNSGFIEPKADDNGSSSEAMEEDSRVANDSNASMNPAYEDIDISNDSDEDSEPECMFYDPCET